MSDYEKGFSAGFDEGREEVDELKEALNLALDEILALELKINEWGTLHHDIVNDLGDLYKALNRVA